MNLGFGSNLVEQSSGIIMADGARLASMTTGDDGHLLATLNIWDASGTRIAALNRNTWTLQDQNYTVETHPAAVTVRRGGDVIAEFVQTTNPDGKTRLYWLKRVDTFTRTGLRLIVEQPSEDFLIQRDGIELVRLDRCKVVGVPTLSFKAGADELAFHGDDFMVPKDNKSHGSRFTHVTFDPNRVLK